MKGFVDQFAYLFESVAGELEAHKAKHTQKREHLCSLCGAEFLYKGNYESHHAKTFIKTFVDVIPKEGPCVSCP